jgi:hypothetical protein
VPWEIDGLADRAAEERLGSRHHADVPLGADVALTLLSAFVGAVEDGVVPWIQMWRAFDGHGAANIVVGSLDVVLTEAEG